MLATFHAIRTLLFRILTFVDIFFEDDVWFCNLIAVSITGALRLTSISIRDSRDLKVYAVPTIINMCLVRP